MSVLAPLLLSLIGLIKPVAVVCNGLIIAAVSRINKLDRLEARGRTDFPLLPTDRLFYPLGAVTIRSFHLLEVFPFPQFYMNIYVVKAKPGTAP